MKIKKGFVKRNIAGSEIVVPVGKATKILNAMITLNETGSFFWDCLQKDITLDELVEKICSEYEVDEERARKDATNFVNLLRENNLLDE